MNHLQLSPHAIQVTKDVTVASVLTLVAIAGAMSAMVFAWIWYVA
jgi:hypothetical protein